jgi:hypothetical protein
MVTLFFSNLPKLIHKLEGLAKVWKLEGLPDVVLLDYLPPIHLPGQGCQRLALERGHPSPARDAGFTREIGHDYRPPRL